MDDGGLPAGGENKEEIQVAAIDEIIGPIWTVFKSIFLNLV